MDTVVDRLIRYAKVYSESDYHAGRTVTPSTDRQFDMAKLLVEELHGLGIENARYDDKCYVYATLDATPGCEQLPAIGLIAHMDTAPDASGENVNPILHENYDGGDVVLPATGKVMKVSAFPFLASMKGETLITTHGTTLLGADDKAGVAEIMTAVETVIREGRPHGKLCIGFQPGDVGVRFLNVSREFGQQLVLQAEFLALVVGFQNLQLGDLNVQVHLFLDERVSGTQCLDLRIGKRLLVHILAGANRGFAGHNLRDKSLFILKGLK